MKNIISLVTPSLHERKWSSISIGRRSLLLLTSLSLVSIISNASAASNVVISQVYGGGGNSGATYKNDFIEIFNRSNVAVSLNGWSVQYASASGTSWTATALPNVNLEPGQYLLVQEALGAGGTVNLPRADASGSIAMSATAGKVVLANVTTPIANVNSASVMDLIGFSATASNFEGAAAAPAPSNTKAVLRGGDGCSDTDNNNDDFTASSPTPRNTATAFNVCNVSNNAPIVAQCPPSLTVVAGLNGQTSLSASDVDGMVNAGAITAGAVNGITLGVVKLAAFNGDTANFSLNVSNAVALGRYPLTVGFSNNQGQKGQCPIEVNVLSPLLLLLLLRRACWLSLLSE